MNRHGVRLLPGGAPGLPDLQAGVCRLDLMWLTFLHGDQIVCF